MVKEIELSQGYKTMIDDEDFERVSQYKWSFMNNGTMDYVHRRNKRKFQYLHRYLLDAPDGTDVDHIDGNGLNNCRSNLRLCTRKQNIRNSNIAKNNTSGYKGVCWHNIGNKWQAQIRVDNQLIYLGLFVDIEEAARAYDQAAMEYFGEFANLNF